AALAGRELRVVARSAERAAALGAAFPWTDEGLAGALAGAGLVVDCTPVALSPGAGDAGPAPGPPERLAPRALVASPVCPREPALLARARAQGLRVMDGAGMLIHQAAQAFTRMTGRPAPLDAMREAFSRPTEPRS